MKKKFLSLFFVIILILTLPMILVACSSSDISDPKDLIINNFGNKEYSVSFSMNTLNDPIPDMTYSAKNMPILPTPHRIGYIFEGWYFDKEYTEPYTDNALFMLMDDVTLYAKWSQEKFVHNGSYDIEYSAKMVDGTLKLGPLSNQYGGFQDFTKNINPLGTYIEKSDEALMLRIEYDSGHLEPFSSGLKAMEVNIAPESGTNVSVYERIESLDTTKKSLFINITKADISKPIYLNVTTHNFTNDLVEDSIVSQTVTSYMVKFEITNIIGFGEAYADISTNLEEGYYLAKAYLRMENNGESMAGSFNPVYSYLHSDGRGHYHLIKEISPYTGLVRPLKDKLTDNYFDRLVSFIPMLLYYDIDEIDNKEVIDSQYYPKTYNGGYFRPLTVEFHKDNGKVYNIIDLGTSLNRDYMVMTAVTGFMEAVQGFGYMNSIMDIDYTSLIKLAECDYKPLEGEAFTFNDEMAYYPGNAFDFDENESLYDLILKYGLNTEMINFFYDNTGVIYDSRITISPRELTNKKSVAQSKYEVKEFDVFAEVFDYDVTLNRNLYADIATVQTFKTNYNAQLRKAEEKRVGKSCNLGDTIRFEDAFREKVYNKIAFEKVNWKAYKIINDAIDFNNPINLANPSMIFNYDFAVKYEYKVNGENRNSLIEFRQYKAPNIKVVNIDEKPISWITKGDNNYSSDYEFSVREKISFPVVDYDFMGIQRKSWDNFYEGMNDDGSKDIDPTMIAYFYADRSGKWKYSNIYTTDRNIELQSNENLLVFEIHNVYGEKEYLKFYISCEKTKDIQIVDGEGKTVIKDSPYVNSDGNRRPVELIYNKGIIDVFTKDMVDSYKWIESSFVGDLRLESYSVFNSINCYEHIYFDNNIEKMVNDINVKLGEGNFGYVYLTYVLNEDILHVIYLNNLTFDGASTHIIDDYKTYFTYKEYEFKKSNLVGSNGTIVGDSSITLNKIVNGEEQQLSASYLTNACEITKGRFADKLVFKQPGDYVVVHKFRLNAAAFGGNFNGIREISFSQKIHVVSIHDPVTITYITDKNHPFKDETYEIKVTYDIDKDIKVLSNFEFNNDLFDSKYSNDILFGWSETGDIKNFILKGDFINNFVNKYNNNNVVLHAIWDPKISLKFVYEDPISLETKLFTTKVLARDEYGRYTIPLNLIPDERLPFRYHNIGWTGPIVNGAIKEGTYYLYDVPIFETDEELQDYLTFTGVIRKDISVRYDICGKYSPESLRWDTVMDGFAIENVDRKNIKVKEGYKLVGWRRATKVDEKGNVLEIGKDNINLKDPITLDMVNLEDGNQSIVILVAVFEDQSGNEVWQEEVTP